MKTPALIAMLILAVAVVYIADRNGYHRAMVKYNAEAAQLAQNALEEQARLQERYNVLESTMHQALAAERENAQSIRVSIRNKPAVQAHCNSDSGAGSIVLSGHIVGLLNKASTHPALPEASNPAGFISKETPVAPANLAEYTAYAISEYNQCAIELNKAIDVMRNF